MVYSMLSSGTVWDRVAKETDSKTGYITSVDRIFHGYNPKELLTCSPEQLQEQLRENHLASQSTLAQMDVALVCEYLRNVGYDYPKPDRHICRILGSDILAFSTNREVSRLQAFQIIFKLAELAEKSVAETDYILWTYCSTGYGEICTVDKPKCDICVANKHCRKQTGDVVNVLKSKLLLHSCYEIKETDSISEIIRKAADIYYMAQSNFAELDY